MATDTSFVNDNFDYVIVGAGASGCVLANRLSENPRHSVLLIESGKPDNSPLIHMPKGFGKLISQTEYMSSHPTTHVLKDARPEVWVRGRTLGGSSSVNGLVYWRGQPGDYDAWAQAGCAGWGWADLLPCFLAMESYQGAPSPTRGRDGPLKVTDFPEHSPVCEAFLDAFAEVGTPRVSDLNTIDDHGVSYNQAIIWKGRRQSAATAFLHPVRSRPNLRVVTDTHVERVVFEGPRAVGVAVRQSAGPLTYRAHREVIVCAGALESPKLLMHSGIGPAAMLQGLSVPVIANAPEVGGNLREHRLFMLQARLRDVRSSYNRQFSGLPLIANVLRYALRRTGPLATASMNVGGFVRTRPGLARTDAQIFMAPFSLDRKAQGYTATMESEPGASLGGYPSRPQSRGRLWIESSDTAAPARIDPNYLSDPQDREISVALVRMMRKVLDQPALASFVVRETYPGTQVQSDDEIVQMVLSQGTCGYHTAGTCRMGADAASVVDTRLRVRGVEGLRVADVSIMPTLVSCNTNAPAMAMAWRASKLILEDAARSS